MSKVFAPKAKTVKAEIVQTESNDPQDLVGSLLMRIFTKYPHVKEALDKSATV